MEETELAPEDEAEADPELSDQVGSLCGKGSMRRSGKAEEEKPSAEGRQPVVVDAMKEPLIKVSPKKAPKPRAGRRTSRMMG